MSASSLCQRCGFCCDGTLFTYLPLQSAEVPAARRHALDVVERSDGSPAIRLCCAAFGGRQCAIYADRPEGCRRYRCMLFAALMENEVSLDEALAVVDEAHALIASVAEALGPVAQGSPAVMQRARWAELAENGGPLPPDAHALRLRAVRFLERHFLGR